MAKKHHANKDAAKDWFSVIMDYADDLQLCNLEILQACALACGFVLGTAYHHNNDHCDCRRLAREQFMQDLDHAMQSAVEFAAIKARQAKQQPLIH
jgi:hypothetical protein